MDIETIKSIFPTGDVSYLTNTGFEVNGLDINTRPLNCAILRHEDANNGEWKFYLISTESYFIFLRICKASDDSPYKEYVVGHSWIEKHHQDAHEFLIDTFRQLNAYMKQ